MKFPLSLDLRGATLAENLAATAVIDANNNRVMLIYPDECGFYNHAAGIVDCLNMIDKLRQVQGALYI